MSGKGSKRRPRSEHCTAEQYARNWKRAFGKPKREAEQPPFPNSEQKEQSE